MRNPTAAYRSRSESKPTLAISASASAARCGRQVGAPVLLDRVVSELLELRASAEVFPPSKGGAEGMAATFGAPFLGRVPLDPALGAACEAGRSYTARPGGAPTKRDVLRPIVDALLREIGIEE